MDFHKSYNKLIEKLATASRQKRINFIETFLQVAESKQISDLPPQQQTIINNSSDDELLIIVKDMAKEAINRDYVSFISRGNVGEVGRSVYASLC